MDLQEQLNIIFDQETNLSEASTAIECFAVCSAILSKGPIIKSKSGMIKGAIIGGALGALSGPSAAGFGASSGKNAGMNAPMNSLHSYCTNKCKLMKAIKDKDQDRINKYKRKLKLSENKIQKWIIKFSKKEPQKSAAMKKMLSMLKGRKF